ncbi:MAG: ubiquinone/menaquinone biosynthesis methyltransferase [Anaerolineales bacterium]|nr:ubiquinone/menaquinone biosynthesis methyltransferase [Anaerolineales bacterium]
MTNLSGQERAQYVQSMFTKIARRYDMMNRLMTGYQDVRWRRQVIKLAGLKPGASLLDLGTGTGDLAREALSEFPNAKVTAADFTLEMMRVGARQVGPLDFSAADALRLPFENESFDAVTSGFLMRNVIDLKQAIQEQYRVLRSGGRIVILDTTRPKRNLLSPFIWIHMHVIIPTLGGLLSGVREAYTYLPDTTEGFVTAEQLAERLSEAGFKNVGYQRLMFGTIAIHHAEK